MSCLHFSDAIVCDIACYPCHVIAIYADIKIQVDVSTVGMVDPLISVPFHIPAPLAYLPRMGLIATNQMNLYQRVINVIINPLMIPFIDHFMFFALYEIVNKTKLGFKSVPTFTNTRASFILINGDFAFDYPRPLTPTAKMVGAILAKPAKSLPLELEQFISSNPNGTIIVSFGTVATAVKHVIDIEAFFRAFALLPYNVVWKYTEEVPPDVLAPNVKVVHWFPQNDLLGHAQVKGFITHCGLNSLLEAVYHGVPVVGMPIVGDQIFHAQKIIAKNVGIVLDIKASSAADIYYAVMNITSDQDIIGNATKASQLMRNRPNGRTALEEANDWVEFALHCDGGEYLRTEEYNLSWYQLYLIDVYLVIAIMLFMFMKVLNMVWKGMAFLCCRRKSKVKQS